MIYKSKKLCRAKMVHGRVFDLYQVAYHLLLIYIIIYYFYIIEIRCFEKFFWSGIDMELVFGNTCKFGRDICAGFHVHLAFFKSVSVFIRVIYS